MRFLASIFASVVLLVPAGCGDDAESGSEVSNGTTTVEVTTSTSETGSVESTSTSTETATTAEVAWPRARGYGSLVYDTESESVLLIGGAYGDQASALRDVWSVDLADANWVEHTDMPPGGGPAGAPVGYDAESDEVIVLQTVFFDVANDPVSTRSYDTDTDTWTDVSSEPQPRLGVGARMVYDSTSDRLVVFGGQALDGSELVYTAETWAYDANTRTWEERAAIEPPGVNYHAMAYDEQSDRTVLFGFTDDGDTLLWAYEYGADTWQELSMAGGPPTASAYQQAVYDPAIDRILVFGGIRPEDPDVVPSSPNELVGHAELWRYDYDANSWEQAATNTFSGPLSSHGMTITADGTVVAFGGGPSWEDYTGNGLWSYDPVTDTWSEHGA